MFKRIDLEKELFRERSAPLVPGKKLLDDANELFQASRESDAFVYSRLKRSSSKNGAEIIPVNKNDSENVFSLDQIKKVCINYRLRFLDAGLFKGEYPYEAIMKIRAFEKRNACEIKE